LCLGCSTFKYTPDYDHVYPPFANHTGLAIQAGEDARPPEEKRPDWTKNAKAIVAHALADEVRHAKLFDRVKFRDSGINTRKFSEAVRFRVIKFECYSQSGFLENTGREFLELQGIRGALIAASIPAKYIAEVEIEFTVEDPSTQEAIFVQTYTATRSFSANGYQRAGPKVQNTSAALESVVTQFVADLTRLPLNQHKPPLR
jgi:hypothetical protein